MRKKLILVAAAVGAGVLAVLVVAVRRHLELFHGRYEGGTDWLIDLEYRVQALEMTQGGCCGPCDCDTTDTADGSDDAIRLCEPRDGRLDGQVVLRWGPDGVTA